VRQAPRIVSRRSVVTFARLSSNGWTGRHDSPGGRGPHHAPHRSCHALLRCFPLRRDPADDPGHRSVAKVPGRPPPLHLRSERPAARLHLRRRVFPVGEERLEVRRWENRSYEPLQKESRPACELHASARQLHAPVRRQPMGVM
jgi:hypothetical protein